MTQEKRRADDGKIRIPREISIGNLAMLGSGLIFAITVVIGATRWYDGLGTRFDAMDDRLAKQDVSRQEQGQKIDMVRGDLVEWGKTTGTRFDLLDQTFIDLRLELQQIRDRLPHQHAGELPDHAEAKP